MIKAAILNVVFTFVGWYWFIMFLCAYVTWEEPLWAPSSWSGGDRFLYLVWCIVSSVVTHTHVIKKGKV